MPKVDLLDYVAGNVRSLVNAIEKVGYSVEWIRSPEDVEKADVSEKERIGYFDSIDSFYFIRLSFLVLSLIIFPEADPSRRRPFRSLHDPIFQRWLSPRDTKTYRVWQTIYGHMRGTASSI